MALNERFHFGPIETADACGELGQGDPKMVEMESAYDEFGNQTLDANYGIVVDGDRTAFDDERIIRTEYAINTESWLVRFPSRSEIMDEICLSTASDRR